MSESFAELFEESLAADRAWLEENGMTFVEGDGAAFDHRAADTFDAIIVAEKHHEDIFRELAANIDSGRVFARTEERIWKCLGCGYLHKGTEAPEKCPACVRKQAYFELLGKNW
mgnify:CR=1 FL=1